MTKRIKLSWVWGEGGWMWVWVAGLSKNTAKSTFSYSCAWIQDLQIKVSIPMQCDIFCLKLYKFSPYLGVENPSPVLAY